MFATHIAVRAMEEAGHWEYAAREKANLLAESDQLEFESMRDLTLPFLPGTHGLAFQIGCRLVGVVGWERLKQLGTMLDEQSEKHDLRGWVDGLDPNDRKVVMGICEVVLS